MPLLFFARDPGPANYLVAVHELVASPELDPGLAGAVVRELRSFAPAVVYVRGAGEQVWHRANVPFLPLDREVDAAAAYPVKVEALTALLRKRKISCVVTGASDIDENTDRALWAAARNAAIPSHAFMDHPASLDRRFRLPDGTQVLPDFIHAPDAAYLPMLEKAGVPLERVSVTGPVHAERLRRVAAGSGQEQLLRAAWGAHSGDKVVLFASECVEEMAQAGRPGKYNEFAVLDDLTQKLEAGEAVGPVREGAEKVVLVVRPHPRDRDGKYNAWRENRDGKLRRVVSTEGVPERAILAADVVVGMDSSLLRDSLALNRPTVSLVGADLRV